MAWLCVLLLASRAALAAPDAAADADLDAATAAEGEAEGTVSSAVASGREELASLLAFASGRLGSMRSVELFKVDLTNDDAVRKRLAELEKDLAVARRAVKDAGVLSFVDDAVFDAGATSDTMALLRLRILEERRKILSLPQKTREALLSSEQEAIRAATARREAAEAEREAERAEQEQLKALQAAQEARTNVERRLAEIRARVEAVRSEQLRARARLTERKHAIESARRERSEMVTDLSQRVPSVAPGSADADALYDRIVGSLVGLRANATSLLDEIERVVPAPRLEGDRDLPAASTPELEVDRTRLEQAMANLERDASSLETEERTAAWSALRSVMATEGRVSELRIQLLDSVSPDKRDQVLGFGEEGRAQGAREIARMRLELRWLEAAGSQVVRDTITSIKRPAAIARISVQVLTVIALVWAAVFVRRRHAVWLRWLRSGASRSMRRPSLVRAVQHVSLALEAVGREAVTLGAVLLAGALPWLDVHAGALEIFYVALLWYWIYRLALGTTHRGLAWAAGWSGTTGHEEVSDKILRSVRLVARTSLFVAVLLASSATVVGKGYLHALVVRVTWVLAFVIGAILVRLWREDIAEAYLHVRPTGALSRLVSQTRKQWVGFFVVLAAFAFVLATGIVRALRRFVLGFEQSRKALAYLFRRRLEKQVEHAPTVRPMLAPTALKFFAEGALEDDELSIDRYPGLPELEERFARFRGGARVGATLLVGRTGYGKTSWLRAARSRLAGADVTSIVLRERATTETDLVAALASALSAPPSTRDVDALVAFLESQSRRVVTVDETQLLFLRGVGQGGGWRAFARVVERTSDVILWIVAFAHYPWEILNWAAMGDHVFRTIVHLAPWSEAEISELLRRRTAASQLEVVYDDLLMGDGAVDASTQILTTARDYDRLIWDYAEGSPRVALHVWSRSLLPDGERRARVRLFANPDATLLEALTESAKFVLAAIVWHERLSLAEAVAVTLVPPAHGEDAFERFVELGIAETVAGRLRITPRWWPVVVRYLRRKHLIET